MNETLIASKAETPTGQKSLVVSPTIEPQRAPAIEAPDNPDVIEITISEVDRQTASEYNDIHNCLICTALRNRGYNVIMVGPIFASLETFEDWRFESLMGPRYLSKDYDAIRVPFYLPSAVGKVVRLHRVTNSVLSV